MTFKAIRTGRAVVNISSNSKILLNDGVGTETSLDLRRSEYTIIPKAPEGVKIFSETHPFQDRWYNNNSPIISWEQDPGVTGFSFILDNYPATVPSNEVNATGTTKSFENLSDGLWYLHIKARKGSVWGTTGHFLVQVDTTPPAEFQPVINFLVAAVSLSERALVSFFTTDNLSGIDHYEVGVINKSRETTESPVFVQSESPFQVPLAFGDKLQIIVRAIDKAGNIRDESLGAHIPFAITKFMQDYRVYILMAIILIGFIMLIMHYLFGHHILRYLRRAGKIMKAEEQAEGGTKVGEDILPTIKDINEYE